MQVHLVCAVYRVLQHILYLRQAPQLVLASRDLLVVLLPVRQLLAALPEYAIVLLDLLGGLTLHCPCHHTLSHISIDVHTHYDTSP